VRVLRPTLVLAAAFALGLGGAAQAGTGGPSTLTFADKAGDNTSPSKAQDITGVTFTTTGKVARKKYVPTSLVITVTLSAPPSADGTTIYEVAFDQPGCGNVYLSVVPGSAVLDPSYNSADCGSAPDATTGSTSTSFAAEPETRGSSLVWTVPLSSLPAPAKVGTKFTALNAFTDLVDPVFGIFGPGLVTGPLYDTAATDTSYPVG